MRIFVLEVIFILLKESLSNTQSLQEKVEKISIEFIEMKGKSFDQLQKFDFHIQELQQVIREKDTEIKLLKSNIPSDQIDQVNTHENIFVSNTSQLPVTSSDITHDMAIKSRNRKKKKKAKL